MRQLFLGTLVLASALSAGGCAMDASEADGFEGAESSEEGIVRAPFGESPTQLTLYSEAGLWGDSLTRSLAPSGDNESILLITKTDIQNANLLNRISSIRLKCGSRDGQIVLFNAYNTGSTISSWSETSPGKPVYCEAGKTVTVNLHTQASQYADHLASVYLVRHAREAKSIAFSMFVSNAWENALEDLPSGAEADGGPKFKLESSTRFKIRQNLKIDDWKCEERGAHFEIRAQMYQNGTFNAYVTSTYVDTGIGDAWGCRTRMEDALEIAANEAAADLEDGLADLLQLAGDHPRYYFVPTYSLADFDLSAGGEPAPPIQNAPILSSF